MNTFSSTVERNKASSKVCKRLFPAWNKPPTQGELQRIIIKCWSNAGTEQEIQAAGNWWLWARNLMIENTFTKQEKEAVFNITSSSALLNQPIHFVSARSPELLHAQVSGQADRTLPRSRKALLKIKDLKEASEQFLPTQVTIIFADLAIDNFQAIAKVCNVEETIEQNIQELFHIAEDIGLNGFQIVKMSELTVSGSPLAELLSQDGTPLDEPRIPPRGWQILNIAAEESLESHKRMFGWSEEKSREHTKNLAVTMGRVGQAIGEFDPPAILIHNEAFISRGRLNNLFTEENPVPVFCLADLLTSRVQR